MSNSDADDYQVDIPVTVPPAVAEEIVADLAEDGRVSITIRTSNAPNIVEQIEWQLENDKPLLEFTEDYDAH
ncbi:hypothetical protein [Halopiger xanaduensis]|uniref:Uncharacterized protein n=1 Tax=Halopiger xanaduensis (strain DSM 18323 / JCM 14033 / SH-6) TaxID=797210 RepID=F8DEP2_HALXS|nr:hypothetical protein [Halopiger xanaduensis]AEH39479.1 hypothetical protein Halxa_0239 [Halopiger xanaduensis SH-6]